MLRTVILLIELSCVLLLVSCGKQKSEINKNVSMHFEQAKHQDIPVPLSFELAEMSMCPNGSRQSSFACYRGFSSVNETVEFYKREMERTGWDIVDLSSGQEGFLYCSKQNKQCGIQVRSTGKPSSGKSTVLCLFITPKK